MKKRLLLLLVLLCSAVVAGAQERWMVGATGSLPFGKMAPVYTAGVEGSYYALESGAFRFGPGIGLLMVDLPPVRTVNRPCEGLDLLAFGRGEYRWDLGTIRPFVLLDAGGMVTVAPDYTYENWTGPGDKEHTSANKSSNITFFFSPMVGVDIGRHFYAAAGVWCMHPRWYAKPFQITASASLKLGVRF